MREPPHRVSDGRSGDARPVSRDPAGRYFAVAGCLILALLAPLPYLGDLRSSLWIYLVLIVTATLVLYGTLFFSRRAIVPGRGLVLAVALLLRLAMLPMAPSLSDDAYRYLWDGRLVASGVNPYLHVPADSTLLRFHDELFRLQGYPTTNTVYPPGAQLVFAASVILAGPFGAGYMGGLIAWKLLLIVAEMTALWLLLVMLEKQGRARSRALLYAWHPLVVVELAGQGHTDVFWVFALALGLYGYMKRGRGGGVPGLAIGGVLRLFPLVLLPLWARFLGWRAWLRGLLPALTVFVLFLPLLEPAAFDNYATVLARFTNYYEFNGGFYYGVKWIADELRLVPSNMIAGAIGTGMQIVLFLLLWCWRPRDLSLPALAWRALLVVSIQIVLAAKVHVWYFVAPLYLLPLVSRDVLLRAWLWVLLVAPFTYLIYAADPHRESMLVTAIEWGGFAVLAVLDWIDNRKVPNRQFPSPNRQS